jgi:hypothetical protein
VRNKEIKIEEILLTLIRRLIFQEKNRKPVFGFEQPS